MIELTVSERGERLDKLVTALLMAQPDTPRGWVSRVRVQQAIKDGRVIVNDQPETKPAYRVETGDRLSITPLDPPASTLPIAPEAIPLTVLYEDKALAAIDKPVGMVVHPALGHNSGTLVNAILARWPQTAKVGAPGRSGIIHRLDKDTSGVILIAKTERARAALASQFKARTIQKRYLALVHGLLPTPTGQIDAPIGRDPRQRNRMAVVRDGRESVTIYRVLQAFDDYSYLELLPKTGRTHQLRVHLAFIGHPIVGDRVYGRRKANANGTVRLGHQFLHAESLTLVSPATNQPLTVSAPLPADLQAALDRLTDA